MIPPVGVPADESSCGQQNDGCPAHFDFRRLGNRVASLLVSPWLPKGQVIQAPKGPTATSEFELSSICATAKTLFNLTSFLTKRDAWAGSFEELLLDQPRPDSDCPMHLPDAPLPWRPSRPPKEFNITCGAFVKGNGCTGGSYETLIVEWSTEAQCRSACETKARSIGEGGCCWHAPVQRNVSSCQWISGGHHDTAGQPDVRSASDCTGVPGAGTVRRTQTTNTLISPRHCPAQQPGTCPFGVTVSQRRKVLELAARTGATPPQLDEMSASDVDSWLAHTLARWLQ